MRGAWDGDLVHLSGVDVIGSTAASISRLLQDREVELWEGKRIVADASTQEVVLLRLNVFRAAIDNLNTDQRCYVGVVNDQALFPCDYNSVQVHAIA